MILQCTKAVIDKLQISKEDLLPSEGYDQYPAGFYAWQVNLVSINRRKALVFINNLTKYPVVIYRPKEKNFVHIAEHLKEGIKAAFEAEGIKPDIIQAYLIEMGELQYSKTAGRSLVANLNEVCRNVEYYVECLDENQIIQNSISLKMGRYLLKYEGKYEYPNEQLFRAICKMMGYPEDSYDRVIEIKTYRMKIKIDLERFDIWRRIAIPANCTFGDLHKVIQRVFGWLDYHLHEFRVIDDKADVERGTPLYAYPIKIRIVDGNDSDVDEYLERDKYEVYYDTKTRLKEIFDNYKECIYTYDFGDNWEHVVTLEKTITDGKSQSPVLLEMQGRRPPEDVGGETGFEEYMKVISDESDPDYESMMQWAEGLKEKELTIEEINRSLKMRI